jgi:hypothetical protein
MLQMTDAYWANRLVGNDIETLPRRPKEYGLAPILT